MTDTLHAALSLALDAQRNAFVAEPMPTLAVRRDRVERIRAMTVRHADDLAAAISQDFGHRARQETDLADIITVRLAARHALRHLRAWMKPRRVPTDLHFLPGRNLLMRQPLGVVGIVAPWNYPYYLAFAPAVAALAAGNRVMIKPSEATPATSALMARMVAEHFAAEEMRVFEGGAEVGRAFASLPFDHLFFTGSVPVGRAVAQAAAPNLTPVTLELGGKSPALVDRSANLATTANRIAFGKLINAGQTCIAPDYVLAPREMLAPLADALAAAMRRLYPTLGANADYSSIASDRHFARLRALLADARDKGARLLPSHAETPGDRKLAPHLLLDVNDGMTVMREEIFGPLLPVLPYDDPAQALAFVNGMPHPLALYWFDDDASRADWALRQTHVGGACINETLVHFAQDELPFGGIGASGMGHYHGKWGFEAFSKMTPVFRQSRLNGMHLFMPPYRPLVHRMLALMKRL